MQLSRFPRALFAHLPTPLEELPRLTAAVGGPRLWIKRDDCTGLAAGGNKTRKLEFLVGDALARGCDTLITAGALQSNHVRQTAAAAAKHGLSCEVLLERAVTGRGAAYERSGNVLLDALLGARVHLRPAGLDLEAEAQALAAEVGRAGRKAYAIPVGGSNPVGALGYVLAAEELLQQAEERDLVLDALVHATGSCGTQAGLLAGLGALHAEVEVVGVSVSGPASRQGATVRALGRATLEHLGQEPGLLPRVVVDDDYVGPGYGQPTAEMLAAVRLAAREEGLLLDPVYTGKALAGLIGLARAGRWRAGANVLFLHTGGSPGLFAYREELEA